MCLEEMLCCDVTSGALFYGKVKRRENVLFTKEMKERVRLYIDEMHDLANRAHTPNAKYRDACNSCSLKDICLPSIVEHKSASSYVLSVIKEDK
jgi:CRISPR-associated exonuclease Cas4